MGIRLQTPKTQTIAADQCVVGFELQVPHARAANGVMKIARSQILLSAPIVSFSDDGRQTGKEFLVLTLGDLPNPVKDALKQLYEWLEGEAQAQGFIGSGDAESM